MLGRQVRRHLSPVRLHEVADPEQDLGALRERGGPPGGEGRGGGRDRRVDLLDRREVNRPGDRSEGRVVDGPEAPRRAGHARSVDPVVHPLQGRSGFRARLANLCHSNPRSCRPPRSARRRRAEQRGGYRGVARRQRPAARPRRPVTDGPRQTPRGRPGQPRESRTPAGGPGFAGGFDVGCGEGIRTLDLRVMSRAPGLPSGPEGYHGVPFRASDRPREGWDGTVRDGPSSGVRDLSRDLGSTGRRARGPDSGCQRPPQSLPLGAHRRGSSMDSAPRR